MKVIGLTGGIGSGKSAATDYLNSKNIPVIDLDILARQVVQPNSKGLHQTVATFGRSILTEGGELDRKKLRETVFNSSEAKQTLENILHPLIRQETMHLLKSYAQQNQKLVIVAYPLLIETIINNAKPDYIDQVWVIDCPKEIQIKRASKRDQTTSEQIVKIIKQQASREEHIKYADVVILNDASIAKLTLQIDQALETL